jgi:hypothetical protein
MQSSFKKQYEELMVGIWASLEDVCSSKGAKFC